jgi:hypothetical protein
MYAGRGSFIAFATGPGQVADDNPKSSNGLFTEELVRILYEPGLSLGEVFDRVREQVDRRSAGRQLPWASTNVIGQFRFRPATATPPKIEGVPPAPSVTTSAGRSDNPPSITSDNQVASGKFIWVGKFPADRSITIDGSQASTGTITGTLPGVPVRVMAWPARLGGKQITAYGRAARPNEPPTTASGWKSIVYKTDERRAKSLVLHEVPAAVNDWRRIRLATTDPGISVVLVEWQRLE